MSFELPKNGLTNFTLANFRSECQIKPSEIMYPINNTAVLELLQAIRENNEVITHGRDHCTSISLLSQVLRTCQRVIGSIDESKCPQASSSRAVLVLLDRSMKSSYVCTSGHIVNESSSDAAPSLHNVITSVTRQRRRRSQEGTAAQELSWRMRQLVQEDQEYECEVGYLYENLVMVPNILDGEAIERFGLANVCMFLSCTATFNLALVHQLAARRGAGTCSKDQAQKIRTALLRKAARLYEICMLLIQDDEQNSGRGMAPSLFDLAVANNLGIAFIQLGNDESAEKCFQYSLSSLMVVVNQNSCSGLTSDKQVLDVGDIDGFLCNASRIMTNTRAAPAA